MRSRGINRKEIDEFGLKDWRWRKRVFVPVYLKDDLMVTWLARSYVKGTVPKILYPSDDRGTKWGIFGYEKLDFGNKKIHLTEGWISAIRVKQACFENVLALCGSRITEEQAELLSRFDEFVVWQEGDQAGKKFIMNVKEWLGYSRKVVVVSLPLKKDPADFQPDKLRIFYKQK